MRGAKDRNVPFLRQHTIPVTYKAIAAGECRLDIFVGGKLVVELKSVEVIVPLHKAQVASYLKATSNELGLLINFNVKYLNEGLHRIILK